MKTLQELLSTKVEVTNGQGVPVKISPDFRVAVQTVCELRGVHIIIHPLNYNGDTLDFWVSGNTLIPITGVVNDAP